MVFDELHKEISEDNFSEDILLLEDLLNNMKVLYKTMTQGIR